MRLLLAALASPLPSPPIVELAVPRSELQLEQKVDATPPPAVGRVALRLNGWAPKNLRLPSLADEVSALEARALPGVSVSLGIGSGWGDRFKVLPILSAAYRGFERRGVLRTASFTQPIVSFSPLFSAGAGLEVWHTRFGLAWLRPYFGLGARAHALVFTASALDAGTVHWGPSLQSMLGAEFMPWGANAVSLDLSLVGDVGRLGRQNLQAMSLQGGLQWSF